jgi:hypothetical protein
VGDVDPRRAAALERERQAGEGDADAEAGRRLADRLAQGEGDAQGGLVGVAGVEQGAKGEEDAGGVELVDLSVALVGDVADQREEAGRGGRGLAGQRRHEGGLEEDDAQRLGAGAGDDLGRLAGVELAGRVVGRRRVVVGGPGEARDEGAQHLVVDDGVGAVQEAGERGLHGPRGVPAIVLLACEGAVDDDGEGLGHLGCDAAQRRERAGADLLERDEAVAVAKHQLAREHLVEDDAERVDVGALIEGRADRLLGRHVRDLALDGHVGVIVGDGRAQGVVAAGPGGGAGDAKSRIFTVPARLSMMLCGLMSRCTMPIGAPKSSRRRCAWASPAATWWAMYAAMTTGIRSPRARIVCVRPMRSWPSISSIAR